MKLEKRQCICSEEVCSAGQVRYQTGKMRPTPDYFNKVASVFFTTLSNLLGYILLLRCRMQRRSGRGQARISPIINHGMNENSEKTSRLSQRNFRLTSRIWIVLVLLVFVISFTHFIWPLFGAVQVVHNYSNADLKAKNYFNETEAGPNPFKFCPNHGPGDELGAKYGPLTLSKSRMHIGTGGRVQRVISRALTGQPVTISVLGGSSKRLRVK